MADARRGSGAWLGFLIMAFVVVGLTGLFSTFAGPLPLQRALAREATLDRVLDVARDPDPAARAAALGGLRPLLGDSVGVLDGPADALPDRVARERPAMRARLQAEYDQIAVRLRVLIAAITLAGALFGAAVVSVLRRAN